MQPVPVKLPHLSRLIATLTMLLVSISTVEASTTQLTITPDPLKFARVSVKHTRTLQVTMSNPGPTSVTVATITNNAPGFSVSNLTLPLTLSAGESVTFSVTFAPTVVGFVKRSITFQNNPSHNLLTLTVRGEGVLPWSLHANPSSLDFGKLAVGWTEKLPVSLTNSGSSSVTVSQDSIAPAGFFFTGLSLPVTIAAGHSFTFHIKFSPQAMGAATGVMDVSNPTSPILGIPLSGTGVRGVTVTPSTLPFGKVVEGTSLQQTGTLSATGAKVTISSANISNPLFVLSGLTFPVTVPAGQNVPFTATFSPVTTGTVSGTLSFVSNAGNSPKETLTGVGIPHSVRLSWAASTSQVAGYNVYRREGTTEYKKINSAVVASTTYTDHAVTEGTTYYYETKAVDLSGKVSAPSNQAAAVIP